jgi:hypothetical protein
MEKKNWDDIPDIQGLSVDWEYAPENPLGKRSCPRLKNEDLQPLLNSNAIMVQVATKEFSTKGVLVDLSQKGAAAFLQHKINPKTIIKFGTMLGQHKFITRGIVQNASLSGKGYRTGIEFVGISKEDQAFILGLHSSASYRY